MNRVNYYLKVWDETNTRMKAKENLMTNREVKKPIQLEGGCKLYHFPGQLVVKRK